MGKYTVTYRFPNGLVDYTYSGCTTAWVSLLGRQLNLEYTEADGSTTQVILPEGSRVWITKRP